jgi:hypothetical protein
MGNGGGRRRNQLCCGVRPHAHVSHVRTYVRWECSAWIPVAPPKRLAGAVQSLSIDVDAANPPFTL